MLGLTVPVPMPVPLFFPIALTDNEWHIMLLTLKPIRLVDSTVSFGSLQDTELVWSA